MIRQLAYAERIAEGGKEYFSKGDKMTPILIIGLVLLGMGAIVFGLVKVIKWARRR